MAGIFPYHCDDKLYVIGFHFGGKTMPLFMVKMSYVIITGTVFYNGPVIYLIFAITNKARNQQSSQLGVKITVKAIIS